MKGWALCVPFHSHLPSYFNGIEIVVLIGPTTDPELCQTEVIIRPKCWLPHIECGLGSIILILLALCRCYSMLIHVESIVNVESFTQ